MALRPAPCSYFSVVDQSFRPNAVQGLADAMLEEQQRQVLI
jgi:hypothetical protein